MSMQLGNITDADVYMNEVDIAGHMEEIDFGSFELSEVEHGSLGMIGVLVFPARPVKAIKVKLKFKWYDHALERKLRNPTKVVKIQTHSHVDIFDEDGLSHEKSHTLVTHLSLLVGKSGGSKGKNGDQMGTEHEASLTSMTQKLYGDENPIVEYAPANRIYNVDGKPVWPS